MAKTSKTKKPKQQDLPGVPRPETYPAIEKLAEKYVEVRDERMELTEKEVQTKAELLGAMKGAGLTVYKYDGKIVQIKEGKENVKVKNVGDDDVSVSVGEEDDDE